MDDHPVLRALSADLERNDPELAARLTAGPQPPAAEPVAGQHRGILWLLLAAALVGIATPVAFGPRAFGVIGFLLLLASPLLVWWAVPPDLYDDGPGGGRPDTDPPATGPPLAPP